MKLEDALNFAREDLSDTARPHKWSDESLVRFFAQAEQEACRRAHLLVDFTTPEICRIALTASKANYTLDKRIIRVERAKLSSRSVPLAKRFRRDMDAELPGWEAHTGAVSAYVQDYSTGILRPYRTPTSEDVLMLGVIREPLRSLTLDDLDREFEIAPRYHEGLIAWVAYRAYSDPDEEKANADLARLHLEAFEREFGQKSSAKNEAWEATHHGEDDMEGLS